MKNYFENSNVNWNHWSPQEVIFKSNNLTKKLLPAENSMSWTSKGDRDSKMCKLTGGQVQTGHQGYSYYGRENYKGVMVQLKDMKSEYPSANVDFIDYTDRKNSVGDRLCNLDVLVYINSHHRHYDWQNVNGKWQRVGGKTICGTDEGYLIAYGGQGDANPMSFDIFQELLQISEAVRTFLVEYVVPAKSGDFNYDRLLVA